MNPKNCPHDYPVYGMVSAAWAYGIRVLDLRAVGRS